MITKLVRISQEDSTTSINVRCPSCQQRGTFESIGISDLVNQTDQRSGHVFKTYIYGHRKCPNTDCSCHIFFIYESSGKQLIETYPIERVQFDTTDIPSAVSKALEEAIICHASNCHIASAIMVRKTLEELCLERGSTGSNLKERIKQLGSKVIMPKELLDAIDELRLLGNDAAHIESQNYNQIGQEEVSVGIEVTKEVLKAVYQYSSLIKRLQGLKKAPT